jgi:hypothetical protein
MNSVPIRARLVAKNAVLVRKALQDLEAEIPRIGRKAVYDSLRAAKTELAKEADIPPGKYPWKTSRQRIYVILAIKSGELPRPYRRTHEYSTGWKLRALKDGWSLANEADHAGWVAGGSVRQARLHRGRWAAFRPTVQKHLDTLDEKVKDSLAVLLARRRQ